MNKHPYNSPKAALLLLAEEDILELSDEGEGGGGILNDPFWQGGEIVFPDIPLG
jgi:hypothetical protein